MTDVSTRFLKYVSFDTMSNPESPTYPSTPGQLAFAQALRQECEDIGLQNARLTDKGFVFATLPSNTEKKVPALGLIAHMDTAPDLTGKDVRPQIVRDYDGGDIVLNQEKNIVLPAAQFPGLQALKGKDIITTDGTTLLGADDKAGIAEILCTVEYLMEHPEIPHGDIHVGFTPDEEVGRGTDGFDVKGFGADYAYTLDGGSIGEIEYENFNACNAKITVHGTSIHPGGAKGRMVHALLIAMELQQMLPTFQSPMCTEEREGFFHLTTLSGDVETTKMAYIIRDHDRTLFEQKKALFQSIAAFLNGKYGPGTVDLQLEDNYYNSPTATLLTSPPKPSSKRGSPPSIPLSAAALTAPVSPSWASPAPILAPAAATATAGMNTAASNPWNPLSVSASISSAPTPPANPNSIAP